MELVKEKRTYFTSGIVNEINKQIEAKMLFKTAYHSQTSRQTERIMPILSTMLSMCVNKFHSSRSTLLLIVTFAYNTTPQSSIKMTSFKLLYERNSNFQKNMKYEIYIENHSKTSEY